ncbi:glyoxylate reductase [Cytospora paraplurivora]|uniref:Glyoxylate reductase n=1 Tax=Cytospora paraplurivora TaxID=2898453 RepID=A0AAN9YGY9_9PEZI
MSRPKVLQLGNIVHAHDTWSSIQSTADIVVPKSTDRASFLAEAASGSFAGCLVAYRTFESVSTTGRIDAELVSSLPASLRFICHNGAGYDQIDIPACTARGIRVSNVPTAVDDATADAAIFLMLGALRNFSLSMHNLRQGKWRGAVDDGSLPALGHDPQGKVLGILGMGGIGRNLARKAHLAFGMKIRYHNRTRLSPELEADCGGAEYWELERLLRESDVLSLNLPLNPKTRHIISTPQFDLMKPGVIIVNTARGAVVDEAALVEALDTGKVAGVGLDVYEDEPQVHPGLLANNRALLVPHMGTWTVETEAKMEEWTMGNVRKAIEEGRLTSLVPEQRSHKQSFDP